MSLTAADRRILRILQTNGRITNQELAERCNMSAAGCHDRLRKLKERGYILGFTAQLDPALLGRSLLIFVEVLLDKTTEDLFQTFASAARASAEVLECHMVAGGFDYLIKVRVADMAAYRAFLSGALVNMPGVRETRTYAVLEQIKSTTELPL